MLPAAVDERVEFLSDGWIEAASAFLRDAVASEPELGNVTCSLSEAFTDPPPHLSRDGALGWHLRLQAGRIEVGPGPLAGADLSVTGDYQAVLSMAQFVYAAGPEARARAERELRHRHGDSALRVRGTLPAGSPVERLLARLHDHMAARTEENSDLGHRAQRLGVQHAIEQLAEQGYCVIERAVSEAFADELRPRVTAEILPHHPLTTNGLMMRDRLFEEVALHPAVRTVAESAVGQGMILGAMSGTYKEAGPGAIDLHSDYALVREPYPEFGMNCVACWALEDWDEAAGPTWVIPGSHRLRRAPRHDEARDGAVPILMPKGSVALWSYGVWHWQGDRSAPGARVTIHVTYNRVFYRTLDDFSDVPESAFARNPPAFSTLMGRDDPFGKSGFTGHDGPRFRHAGRRYRT